MSNYWSFASGLDDEDEDDDEDDDEEDTEEDDEPGLAYLEKENMSVSFLLA